MSSITSNLYIDVYNDNKSWCLKKNEGLTDDEASIFAKEIEKNAKLENLAIVCFDEKSKGLSTVGGRVILKTLKNHHSIKSLTLRGNRGLGDDIASAVVKMLKNHPSLRILDLTNCALRDKGAIIIAKGLRHNHVLEELQIFQGNSITRIHEETSDGSQDDDLINMEISMHGEIQLAVAVIQRGNANIQLQIS